VADESYWQNLFALADKHDVIILADECYGRYLVRQGNRSAPCLLRLAQSGGFHPPAGHFILFPSGSGLPGLRSGMVAGDATLIEKIPGLSQCRRALPWPAPLLAASAALWRRTRAHVVANRAAYQEKMGTLPNAILGNRMIRPGGGFSFFLWLDVGNGEDFARRAWAEQGVRPAARRLYGPRNFG